MSKGFRPIPTEYNGYRFRSRLEARWAVFFDAIGLRYEYEPEGYETYDGIKYLPDFYLPDLGVYFEVKRASVGEEEKKKILQKIEEFAYNRHSLIICFGDPVNDDLYFYGNESDDGGGGEFNIKVTISESPYNDGYYVFAHNNGRERTFFTSPDFQDTVPGGTTEGKYKYQNLVTKKIIDARFKARKARFEYGETPHV